MAATQQPLALHVRPMTSADLPLCTDTAVSAYLTDELFAYICPYRHEHLVSFRAAMLRDLWRRYLSKRTYGHVCVDTTTSRILGHVFAIRRGPVPTSPPSNTYDPHINTSLSTTLERRLRLLEARYVEFFALDLSSDPVNAALFAHHHAAWQPLADQPEARWHISMLAVASTAQRRGVGRELLGWVFERAREEGLRVTLLASLKGKGLYEKVGFEVVGLNEWWYETTRNDVNDGAAMVWRGAEKVDERQREAGMDEDGKHEVVIDEISGEGDVSLTSAL